jgi:hypothetical protein
MKEYYLVMYCGGDYEDRFDNVIFVTENLSTAKKYCKKFNSILKKWKDYFMQFETKKYEILTWLKDEHIETKFYRWNKIKEINKCYYEAVKIR